MISPKELAKKIRLHSIKMANSGGSSHVGSALSCADIISVLYSRVMNIHPKDPSFENRDRFILSKGHAGSALYAALAETGFFSIDDLRNHYKNGSIFSGHVSHKGIKGVEISTGSLGHGLGIGAGFALAGLKKKKDFHVFVLLSDGECDEGSNWEAILFSNHFNLYNLTAIIDYNKIQSLASTSDTMDLEPFSEKWKSFGWNVYEADGHNHKEIEKTLNKAKNSLTKPSVIICHTIKGKGVSFMENSVLWHYRSPQGEEFQNAINEIEGS